MISVMLTIITHWPLAAVFPWTSVIKTLCPLVSPCAIWVMTIGPVIVAPAIAPGAWYGRM